MRVQNLLPQQGIGAIYGPSGAGKSFFILEMLGAIAQERDFFDLTTTAAPTTHVACEGAGGIPARLKAYAAKHGTPDRLRVILPRRFDLREAADRRDIAAAIRDAGMADGVVCIDTLNRAAPGADENDSRDMGRIIDALADLRETIGGLLLAAHHTGKDATKGLRGHSSLAAALDVAIEITRDGDRRSWRLSKAKDGEDSREVAFTLEQIEIGNDAEGWPATSCVIVPAAETAETAFRRPAAPSGGNQKIAFQVIGELLRDSRTFGQAGAPPLRPCIQLEESLATIGERLPCEPARRRDRARQAVTALINRGLYKFTDGWVWCP